MSYKILILFFCGLTVVSCGQKGALYLPRAIHEVR